MNLAKVSEGEVIGGRWYGRVSKGNGGSKI